MQVEHFEDVLIDIGEYLLVWSHLNGLFNQSFGLVQLGNGAAFAESNRLCFSEVELTDFIRECKGVITGCLCKGVVVEVDVGGGHVEVELNQE